jgi:predicted ester cyclase
MRGERVVISDTDRNLAAFRTLLEQGFGSGDTSVVDRLVSEDEIEHQFSITPANRDGVKNAITFLHRLAPDFNIRVEALCADGDLVWGRMTARGTHTGPGLGEPTGRRFDVTVIDVCRFQDGRIVEHWGVADRFAQMQQLGLLPHTQARVAA